MELRGLEQTEVCSITTNNSTTKQNDHQIENIKKHDLENSPILIDLTIQLADCRMKINNTSAQQSPPSLSASNHIKKGLFSKTVETVKTSIMLKTDMEQNTRCD